MILKHRNDTFAFLLNHKSKGNKQKLIIKITFDLKDFAINSTFFKRFHFVPIDFSIRFKSEFGQCKMLTRKKFLARNCLLDFSTHFDIIILTLFRQGNPWSKLEKEYMFCTSKTISNRFFIPISV